MTVIRKKMEIKRIPFSKLLKQETPELADQVIAIVDSHNPEELKIKEVYDLLVAKQPLIKNLRTGFGAHPITLQLKPMREEMMLHISYIKLQLRLVTNQWSKEHEKDWTVVKTAIDYHLLNLRSSKNESVLIGRITGFFDEMSTNEELADALDTLDFTPLLEKLQSAHATIQQHLSKRSISISQRPNEKHAEVADTVVEAIKDLFKQIEVAQLKNPDLDYAPLFNELNVLATKFRNQVSLRLAHNRRKAEEQKENEATDTTPQPEVESTEGSNGSYRMLETNEMDVPQTLVATTNGAFAHNVETLDASVSDVNSDESIDEKKDSCIVN